MIGQLTKAERQYALLILLGIGLCGLMLSIAGRDDPLSVHGVLIGIAALAGIFKVISIYFDPEPDDERLARYCDDPTKFGIVLAMAWAVFGMFVGNWVAWLLVKPDLTFDAAWVSFGRLRPVHTTSVLFGFGGNALIATSFYVLQRTSRAPARSTQSMVRAAWLQFILRARRHRLYDGYHPIQGIYGARVVRGYLAGGCVGCPLYHLYSHARAAQGTSYLCS